jgi:hypothetical protein
MMDLQSTKRPIPLPTELCWPNTPDQLDAGQFVFCIEALPGRRVRVMTLAGPMIISRDDIDDCPLPPVEGESPQPCLTFSARDGQERRNDE